MPEYFAVFATLQVPFSVLVGWIASLIISANCGKVAILDHFLPGLD